jgi:hypothetical protein
MLFGPGGTGFVSINPSTGVEAPVGPASSDNYVLGDAAFDSANSQLYLVDESGNLVAVNPTGAMAGVPSKVATLTTIPGSLVFTPTPPAATCTAPSAVVAELTPLNNDIVTDASTIAKGRLVVTSAVEAADDDAFTLAEQARTYLISNGCAVATAVPAHHTCVPLAVGESVSGEAQGIDGELSAYVPAHGQTVENLLSVIIATLFPCT